MKLEKFKEKNSKKIEIILFTITCVLLISGVLLYRTFAIFETNDKYDVMNGRVEDPGDIYFAFYKDGVIQKEMPTKNEGYVLDESKSYCGVLGSHNQNIKVSMTEDEMIQILGVTTSRTKCNLYFVQGKYIQGKGIPVIKEGEGLYAVSTSDDLDVEYRYAGQNPNNYLMFNNELWRIIGLVNVMTSEDKVEQRVKIVRNDSIGKYSWDSTNQNDWNEASLMHYLNDGNYYNGIDENSLKDHISKNMIDENIVWNIGGVSIENSKILLTKDWYRYERGTTVYPNRLAIWKGKVALMYPSDYGWSFANLNPNIRINCLNKSLNEWPSECYNNSWMYSTQREREWLLTPNTDYWYNAGVLQYGIIEYYFHEGVEATYEIRPTLYLKLNSKIIYGNGTEMSPFRLATIEKNFNINEIEN